MSKIKYNSWPLGEIPKEFQRTEIDKLKEIGYKFDDPRDVINIFEKKVAKFSGSKYAVAIDCCSNGLFLSLKYLITHNKLKKGDVLEIPKNTYVSVPMQIKHAELDFKFINKEWSGVYNIGGTSVYDGAVRWTKNMFVNDTLDTLQVVSFQIKKRIPIGRGGMILTNDKDTYNWLKLASYDGRDLNVPYTDPDHIKSVGYHMYMTPEDAARGIILMDNTPEENPDSGNHTNYPDISNYNLFKNNLIY